MLSAILLLLSRWQGLKGQGMLLPLWGFSSTIVTQPKSSKSKSPESDSSHFPRKIDLAVKMP